MSSHLPRRTDHIRNKPVNPLIRLFQATFIGLVGAWLAVIIWNGVSGDLGIIAVHASIRPATSGTTVLSLPPFGSASANTHMGPVKIDLRIDEVHIKETAEWLKQNKSPQDTADLITNGIKQIAYKLARLSIVVALFGALAACALLRFGWKYALCGTVVGVLGVALPLALAAYTYNTAAFSNPTFEGEMSRAPHLLYIAERAWKNNSGLVQDVPRIANRAAVLYQRLEHTGYDRFNNPQHYYRVLVISDLHNNPIAVKFALDLARAYKANLVLMAGDSTDLGHPLEASLLAGLREFHVPIVAVAGNHDSRATIAVLKTIPGLTVIDNGQTVTKGPLSVMGFGDPAARRADTGSVDTTSRQLNVLQRRMVRRIHQLGEPDILLVHNDRAGRDLAGRVPLIVDGHLHHAFIRSRGGSVIVNPGTTGASGIRYFSAKERPSYSAAVLHFSPGAKPRLRVVDTVEMQLPSGDFSVIRKSVSARAADRQR